MRPSALEPITKGVLLALFSVAMGSIGGAFFLGAIPPASPDLLRSLATIGAILVPAYVVEVVWLSRAWATARHSKNGSASSPVRRSRACSP